MPYKIYLVTRLDDNKKYVGITSSDLQTRWQQHYHDKASAIYDALRSDGHRMVMDLLQEVETKEEALRLEQKLIQELNTAQPNGWNRSVSRSLADPSKETLLRRSWPDAYKMKWRKLSYQPRWLKILGQIELSEVRYVEMDLDIFAPLDYHIQFAIEWEPLAWRHFVLVFNGHSTYYGEDESIIFTSYEWTEDGWHGTDIARTQFSMLDKNLWRDNFRDIVKCWQHKHCLTEHEIIYRPKYSRGSF